MNECKPMRSSNHSQKNQKVDKSFDCSTKFLSLEKNYSRSILGQYLEAEHETGFKFASQPKLNRLGALINLSFNNNLTTT